MSASQSGLFQTGKGKGGRRSSRQEGKEKKKREEKYYDPRFGSYNLKSKDLKKMALKLLICYPETEN